MLKISKEKETYLEKLKENTTTLEETMKNTENVQTLSSELEKTIINSLEQDKASKTSNEKPKIITKQTQELISKRTELLSKRKKSKEMRHELKELYKKTNRAIRQDYERHRRIIIERNMVTYKSSKRALKELATQRTKLGYKVYKMEKRKQETEKT
ncbi:unnamed protein product [Parnassius apollo]|uniref:(apollo) hypothetical protein n=1 Tax=Parnassius apollo TaxID=110799 RepID=A0A8S3XX41_PARAO|nr:unnamed protein product [Parnassius apollo]